jgi:hypothetical protein
MTESIQWVSTSAYSTYGQPIYLSNIKLINNDGSTTEINSNDSNITLNPTLNSSTSTGTYNINVTYKELRQICLVEFQTPTPLTYKINKASLYITVNISNWQEGSTASIPSVSGNTGNGTVIYEYKGISQVDSAYTTTKPITAGIYRVKANVAETTNYNGTIVYKDFTITQASQPTTTYYWYVGYDQNAYEHRESFKANMYITTTNAVPTQYSKSGDNGFFI